MSLRLALPAARFGDYRAPGGSMLPNRNNQVRVRANFDGEVELLVTLGERIHAGQALVVIEGDKEIERLASRNPGAITEIHVRTGEDVQQGALLVVLQEIPEEN